jgi:hypothetical protein
VDRPHASARAQRPVSSCGEEQGKGAGVRVGKKEDDTTQHSTLAFSLVNPIFSTVLVTSGSCSRLRCVGSQMHQTAQSSSSTSDKKCESIQPCRDVSRGESPPANDVNRCNEGINIQFTQPIQAKTTNLRSSSTGSIALSMGCKTTGAGRTITVTGLVLNR